MFLKTSQIKINHLGCDKKRVLLFFKLNFYLFFNFLIFYIYFFLPIPEEIQMLSTCNCR